MEPGDAASATPQNSTMGTQTPIETIPTTISSTWIILEIVNIICFTITIYVLTALIIHRCRQRQARGQAGGVHSENTSSFDAKYVNRRPRTASNTGRVKRDFDKLQNMVIVGTGFASLRILSQQMQLLFGGHSDSLCDIISKTQVVLYALPYVAIYGFLWGRQRTLYAHPHMKLLSTKKFQIASWSGVITLVIAVVSISVIFLATRSYAKSDLGCALKSSTVGSAVPYYTLLGFIILFQSLLLALFICPLMRHRTAAKTVRSESNAPDHIKPIIVRVLMTVVVCVLSDVTAFLATIATSRIVILHIVYDANLVVNVLGVCFSFADWKERLFPRFSCVDHSVTQNSPQHRYDVEEHI